jgi:hypothetical protein
MDMRVVELANLFDTRHEAGKLLELGPLVIYGANRTIHFDNFLYLFHDGLLAALSRRVAR